MVESQGADGAGIRDVEAVAGGVGGKGRRRDGIGRMQSAGALVQHSYRAGGVVGAGQVHRQASRARGAEPDAGVEQAKLSPPHDAGRP